VTAVTWLGHSTLLIEAGGARLLTDPVLRPRVAHLTRRLAAPDLSELGPLDAVLLSHVHRDHLDVPTLRGIPAAVPVLAPVGAAALMGKGRVVHELEPGEQLELAGTSVLATPAMHEVRRRFRRVQALGFLVGGIYFAGDTDVFDGMGELGALDLALLPVWGWGPTLGTGHMNPEAAARALVMLRPRAAVPIHWGTLFPIGLTGDRLTEPPREFARHAARLAPEVEVRILEPGATMDLRVSFTPIE
jgi:L-ascorbate metabolism protein UlaG (beta-lactamase superfamily)